MCDNVVLHLARTCLSMAKIHHSMTVEMNNVLKDSSGCMNEKTDTLLTLSDSTDSVREYMKEVTSNQLIGRIIFPDLVTPEVVECMKECNEIMTNDLNEHNRMDGEIAAIFKEEKGDDTYTPWDEAELDWDNVLGGDHL